MLSSFPAASRGNNNCIFSPLPLPQCLLHQGSRRNIIMLNQDAYLHDVESAKLSSHYQQGLKWSVILQLAFQSIGVVYGDIGTSPLYVFPATFSDGIKHNDDILGVLSLIIYTITLIPLFNYIFIVLPANHNGDGGTFALYSLICRYAKVGLVPSQLQADNMQMQLTSNKQLIRALRLKSKLEKSHLAKVFLLFATMLGTSMVIGDGILTPSISVLSAIGGIKEATCAMTQDRVVWTSVGILVCLFSVQRFGTEKVGYCFAPIICIWFAFIGGIGIYNLIKYDPGVIRAIINPIYIFNYFARNQKQAWISLGGIILSVTGSEALFADVGHFTVRSIQISMCSVTYPALVLTYIGQASFLRKHNHLVGNTFFKSIPHSLYWPVFVLAVLSSIIASQAMISGTFSIIQQSLSLGCFPRVRVVHTSTKYPGQVYIPEINYLLMAASICVTIAFRTTDKIGNAYGIAVVFVMVLTSSFLVVIMIMIWKTHILLVVAYVLLVGTIELIYLSSVLYKFYQGGYLPLAFAAILMTVMYVWNDVYRRKCYYELNHKVSLEKVNEIITSNPSFCRLPGLAIFYSELGEGIPPIFEHYSVNVPALHSVVVFVSIKLLPISTVPSEERFVFGRVDPKELNVYHCVVRYGYTDTRNEHEAFERLVTERLIHFVREELFIMMAAAAQSNNNGDDEEKLRAKKEEVEREMEGIERASRAGIVHLMGENEVVAGNGAGIAKRILIDYAYSFLKRNLRQTNFHVPPNRMLKVGMIYEL